MLEEANTEYEQMEADLNEMNNKFDVLYQEIEDKVQYLFYYFLYIHLKNDSCFWKQTIVEPNLWFKQFF